MDIPHAEQQKCHWHLNLQGIKNKGPRGQKARLGRRVQKLKPSQPHHLHSWVLTVHSTVLLGCGCGKNINPANFNHHVAHTILLLPLKFRRSESNTGRAGSPSCWSLALGSVPSCSNAWTQPCMFGSLDLLSQVEQMFQLKAAE